jgi:hypothetical protein
LPLFRNSGLSQNVTQDSLALFIGEAGKALLDPRLAVSSHHAMTSQLDESTSSQMVRAINKVRFREIRCNRQACILDNTHFWSFLLQLAVQAATGSPRDVSIEALLALQLQLCTVGNETAADAAFNRRLSRIVTKLFAKVLKAEAASARPFSANNIDVEAIICALDDMLIATDFAPGASTWRPTMQWWDKASWNEYLDVILSNWSRIQSSFLVRLFVYSIFIFDTPLNCGCLSWLWGPKGLSQCGS